MRTTRSIMMVAAAGFALGAHLFLGGSAAAQTLVMPNVLGCKIDLARSYLEGLGFKVEWLSGGKSVITGQDPDAGSKVEQYSLVTLSYDPNGKPDQRCAIARVPKLVGLSYWHAEELAKAAGFALDASALTGDRQVIVDQKPTPDTIVPTSVPIVVWGEVIDPPTTTTTTTEAPTTAAPTTAAPTTAAPTTAAPTTAATTIGPAPPTTTPVTTTTAKPRSTTTRPPRTTAPPSTTHQPNASSTTTPQPTTTATSPSTTASSTTTSAATTTTSAATTTTTVVRPTTTAIVPTTVKGKDDTTSPHLTLTGPVAAAVLTSALGLASAHQIHRRRVELRRQLSAHLDVDEHEVHVDGGDSGLVAWLDGQPATVEYEEQTT